MSIPDLWAKVLCFIDQKFYLFPTIKNLHRSTKNQMSNDITPNWSQFLVCYYLWKKISKPYLFNIFHHNSFHFRYLSFHFRKFADLLGVIHTILHMLLQFRPISLPQNWGIRILHSKGKAHFVWWTNRKTTVTQIPCSDYLQLLLQLFLHHIY